jgi:hypothetical protein
MRHRIRRPLAIGVLQERFEGCVADVGADVKCAREFGFALNVRDAAIVKMLQGNPCGIRGTR